MQSHKDKKASEYLLRIISYIVRTGAVACVAVIIFCLIFNKDAIQTASVAEIKPANEKSGKIIPADAWKAPDSTTIPAGKAGWMIRYGKELIAHTAVYFGPKGSIAHVSNGMNCQNCHLEGGSRLFGNNFAAFISSYPKMSNRSGKMEPPAQRIVDCFTRSLAGKSPDTAAKEVRAMLAYLAWMGKDVKKGDKLFGNASEKLPYLATAADTAKGKLIFAAKCTSCHGTEGEGLLAADKKSYTYPPLWGPHSYNDGAGMYRLGNLAGFVKNNMPFGATYQNPQLSDEEAWNVAAFINTRPRLHRDQHNDFTNLDKKPIDAPFGPYIDTFSEKQHKLGPFKPILAYQKTHTIKNNFIFRAHSSLIDFRRLFLADHLLFICTNFY